ncbi:hypothetical protein E2C01_076542 [Portunus trituberculatus]|uniref:Uncharacterized protein n=1 Tax=Portunus trituberculatus TaxID=210409 RepID=A0A5B7IHX3_PORTR|nr:hypothetical protein [Portunus trituberculatus]
MTSRGLGYIRGDMQGCGHKRFDQLSVKTHSFHLSSSKHEHSGEE